MNVSDWIDRWAARQPTKTAISCSGVDYSYAAMSVAVARMTDVLRRQLGVRPGDRVAYLGLNRTEVFTLVFACARIGALYLPLNWRQTPSEHAYILSNATPAVMVTEQQFAAATLAICGQAPGMKCLTIGGPCEGWLALEPLLYDAGPDYAAAPSAGYDAPLLLCYTSGTTGKPKGAMLTQNAVLFNAINSTHMHDLTSRDRILVTLPLFHVGGLNIQSLPALHAGASVFLHPAFDPLATLAAIDRDRITLTVLVPAQLRALIGLPQWRSADFSTLRVISTGSVTVPESLIRSVHQRKIPLIQVYGSTETSPIAAYLRADEAEEGIGSGGKCAVHCEIKIVDDAGNELPTGKSGEILVRGPNVMVAYWQDPEMTAATLKDGWFHSGDIGHFDDRGYLYIDDRKKDMIISGGENIYPAVLECILAEFSDLAESAVVGRPDERWEEVAVAIVVPRAGADVSAADVIAFLSGRVARFAIPKEVVFVEALPRNAMGKVVKSQLRDLVVKGAAAKTT